MRLIDADALAKTEQEKFEATRSIRPLAVNEIMHRAIQGVLAAAPEVDAVPVVRCKDCQYLMFSDFYGECAMGCMRTVLPMDFCSRGSRKDDADG